MVRKLQNDLREAQEQHKTAIAEKETQMRAYKVDSALQAEFAARKVVLPTHLKTDDEKRAHEQLTRDSLMQQFKSKYEARQDDKGNIIFYNKAGEPMTSKQDGTPLGAGAILDSEFKTFFIPNGHQQAGTGGTNGNEGGGAGGGTFKTTKEVHAHLASKGLDARSQEYQDQFNSLVTENKISIGGVTLKPTN
jgi:hypothetical protein